MDSLSTLLNWGTEILSQHQIPTARLDAEVLMAHLLGIDRVQLYVQFERKISESDSDRYKKLIERRISGEPVSYIRGVKEFWSLPFFVGPGVMIPRPDTEVLVDTVVKLINSPSPPLKLRGGWGELCILDIGTGSGNLAIALAKEFPQARITAIDISAGALAFARDNAKINKVENQIVFLQEDFLNWKPLQYPFDLIISNPPYVPTNVIETLDVGIRNFEPKISLDGGADGLDFYRIMGDTLPALLKPGGMVAVEIGEDQANQVTEIFVRAGLSQTEIVKDYSGLARVILARANF